MTQLKSDATGSARAPNLADVASLDAIINALYDVISGPAGQARDWDRLRSLFAPGARLMPTATRPNGETGLLVLTVEEYIASARQYLEGEGFFEREIARRTESFGQVTHAFSTYDSKHKAEDALPFARGINSLQLLNDGKRWWVVSIFWDAESPENPIPPKYLQSG